jgi:hypothetical protein
MSSGKIHPSTESVRKKMDDWDGGTNSLGWVKALEGFSDAFKRHGLTPPKYKRVVGMSHEMLSKQLSWGRGFIGAYHYGVVADRNRRLWSSTMFRGYHAMFQMRFRTRTDIDQSLVYDPLADGRTVGGKTMAKGPKWWNWSLVKQSLAGYAGPDRASGVIVWRSELLTPTTPPPTPPDENEPGTGNEEPLDPSDQLLSYLSDLEEQYESMGDVIAGLRAAVGPDNDSTAEPTEGVKADE